MIDPEGNHTQLTNPTDVDRPAPAGSIKYQKGVGVLDRGGLSPTQTTGRVARAEALHGFDKNPQPLGQRVPEQGGWIGERKKSPPGEFWHGSPTGDLRGGISGLHLGSREAAETALRARIGWPADGTPWDGTREYG